MYDCTRHYINGQWTDSTAGRNQDIINPATEESIGSVVHGTAADVDKAVIAARAAFEDYSQWTVDARLELLGNILDAYKARYKDIADAITAEMGAPTTFSQKAQTAAGIGHLKATIGALQQLELEEKIGHSTLLREPVGVCGLITPWNWPINQIMCKVAPALAAGCTVVLKPSEIAPVDATIFAEVLDAAGVPAGVFNLVHGDGPGVGSAMSAHPDIDMMSFTGSTRAGVLVAKAAADTVKRVAQELGGKSANIILEGAPLEQAIKHGVHGMFGNTGQSCNAPSRMLVPESVFEEAVTIAEAVASHAIPGDPQLPETHIGPVISEAQFNKIQGLIEKGIEEGAGLVCGGPGKPDGLETGYFVKPTIFRDVNNDMTIAREEIFGPVLCMMPYSDIDQAVRIANDTVYGLSGYVYGASTEEAMVVARRLRTGMVHLNGAANDINAPFGGYKQSGNGREWGLHGLEDFLEVKIGHGCLIPEICVKKILFLILLVLVAVVAVLVFRTATVYTDQQLMPAQGIDEVNVDSDAAVERFATALTFPTISNDDRSQFDAQAFTDFRDFLESAYPLVHQQASRTIINSYSLLFHLPGTDPSLEPVLFMSHMDVVPIEEITRPEWTHPPFDGVVSEGIIWGRGSLDDKIGVISLMEAMELLLSENNRPERSVYLAFGHDEEVGGKDGAAKIAEHLAGQGLRFDFVLDEGGAVTRDQIEGIDNEVAVIGVSEKGYVNLRLTVNAPGGHSSQPPDQTGLGILARAIINVEDNPFPTDIEPLLMTFDAIGDRAPFSARLGLSNLWLLSAMVEKSLLSDQGSAAGIRTTTAATMITGSPKANILPTRAEAVINFRILPGETVETVKQRVIGLIDDPRVTVTDEYGKNPSPVSPIDTRGYRIIASTIRGTDEDILAAPYMVRGGTDATNFYSVSDNVYRFLMVRVNSETMKYLHGIDERVPVEDYLQAIGFYYHVMRQAMAEQ